MITAPKLEIAVLVLGMVILLVEAFATKIDKRVLALVAIAGLALVLVASFFVSAEASANQTTGFWSFYTADRLSIFFKQFSLLTTIVVLVVVADYPTVLSYSRSAQSNLVYMLTAYCSAVEWLCISRNAQPRRPSEGTQALSQGMHQHRLSFQW